MKNDKTDRQRIQQVGHLTINRKLESRQSVRQKQHRASRQTELGEQFPIQVVDAWMGNTPNMALDHYLMTTDEHFAKAVAGNVQNPKATQKAAQQIAEMGGNGKKAETPAHEKTPVLPGFAKGCGKLPGRRIGPEGLEPPTNKL